MKNAALILGPILLSLTFVQVGSKNAAQAAQPSVKDQADDNKEQHREDKPSYKNKEILSFSNEHGEITWVGSKKIGSDHDGGFHVFSGDIRVIDGSHEKSSLEFTIDLNSIWSDNERLTAHLKNDDFFAVEKHPEGKFVSTRITENGAEEGKHTHIITGNLTLRGTTKSISFPATIEVSDDDLRAKGEFSLNRMQFGISFRGLADNLIRETALVRFSITVPRQ